MSVKWDFEVRIYRTLKVIFIEPDELKHTPPNCRQVIWLYNTEQRGMELQGEKV